MTCACPGIKAEVTKPCPRANNQIMWVSWVAQGQPGSSSSSFSTTAGRGAGPQGNSQEVTFCTTETSHETYQDHTSSCTSPCTKAPVSQQSNDNQVTQLLRHGGTALAGRTTLRERAWGGYLGRGMEVVWCGCSMGRSTWRAAGLSFPMALASHHMEYDCVRPDVQALKLISNQFTRNSLHSPRYEIFQAGELTSCACYNLQTPNFTAAVRQYLKSQRQKWPSVKQKL